MRWGSSVGSAARVIAVVPMLMGVTASDAFATQVRFVHAVPGAGAAQLSVDGHAAGPAVGFAQATGYASSASGEVKLSLAGGGKSLAGSTQSLGNARYTIVALRQGGKLLLKAFRDAKAKPGRAELRGIHAAAELGKADLLVDGKTAAKGLPAGQATPYASLDPGTYKLEVMRPGGKGGALASRSGVALAAGTATTAVVVGSGGEPTRFVVLPDSTSAPAGAPGTGLGGLDGGRPWTAALVAALVAGLLGASAHRLVVRRRAH